MLRSPQFIAGHHVEVPEMCCLGMKEQLMVYVADSTAIAIAETSQLTADPMRPWPMPQFRFFSLPASVSAPHAEEISVVSLHSLSDWLCVGTKHSGLYLTRGTDPCLSTDTHLPMEATGEYIHCACFVTDTSTEAEEGPGAAEYLVYSSSGRTLREKESPHRLSVWSIARQCVVWRGKCDPLHGMCPLFPHFSFSACSAGNLVHIFLIRVKDDMMEDSRSDLSSDSLMAPDEDFTGRYTMVSRACATSDGWGSNPSFVSCASRSPHLRSRMENDSFVALTNNGFLVEFDKYSGAVLKWMDCKDPKGVSVRVSGNLVIVSGVAIRYFDGVSWEFNGKHQMDVHCWSGPLPSVVAVTTLVYQSRSISFLSNGGLLVHSVTRGADAPTPHSGLHFKRLYNYIPLVDNGSERVPQVHWVQPAVDGALTESTPCGLWSVFGIRVVDSGDLHSATQIPQRFNCATYNPEWNLLVAQCAQTGQLVAFDPQDMWAQKATLNFRFVLTSMSINDEGTVACLGENQRLYYVACRWIMSGVGCVSSLILEHRSERELDKGPFHSIRFVGDKLYAVSSTSIMDVSSREEVRWKEPILETSRMGARLLLLFSKHCEVFDPLSPVEARTTVALPFGATAMSSLVTEPTGNRLAVVAERNQAFVFDVNGEGSPLFLLDHRSDVPKLTIKMIAFSGVGKHSWRLLVGDSKGTVSAYHFDTVKKKPQQRQRASPLLASKSRQGPSALRRQQTTREEDASTVSTSRSSGKKTVPAPSSDQLSSRFSELSDFYRNQAGRTSTPRSAAGFVAEEKQMGLVISNKASQPVRVSEVSVSALTLGAHSIPFDHVRGEEGDVPEVLRESEGVGDELEEDPEPQPENLLHSPEKPPVVPITVSPPAHSDPTNVVTPPSHLTPRREPEKCLSPHSNSLHHSLSSRVASLHESLTQLNSLANSGQADEVLCEHSGELQQLYELLTRTLQTSGQITPSLVSVSGSLRTSLTSPETEVLRAEMVRIQEQNRRLEEQNKEILSALRSSKQAYWHGNSTNHLSRSAANSFMSSPDATDLTALRGRCAGTYALRVTGFPLECAKEEIQPFLQRNFCGARLMEVFHPGTPHTLGIISFSKAEEVRKAVESSLDLQWESVCRTSAVTLQVVAVNCRSLREGCSSANTQRWEGLPLPPTLLSFPHGRCAYLVGASEAPNCSTSSENWKVVELSGTRHRMTVKVVVFGSVMERDEMTSTHGFALARCGPPSLPSLLEEPSEEVVRMKDVLDRKRTREEYESAGLQGITVQEALSAVQEWMEGKGRVAVKDHYGNIAILRVPTYVSSIVNVNKS